MRCPKCHYLSFDPEPRCRNCGNSLSLEQDDLFIREESPEEVPRSPFADVNLRAADVEPPPPVVPTPSLSRDVSAEERAAVFLPAPSAGRSRPAPTTELPLFVKGMSGSAAAPARLLDEPLVQLPEDPRPPLAVRREPPVTKPAAAAPERLSRRVAESKATGPLDRDLLADLQRTEALDALEQRARRGSESTAAVAAVGAGPRLAAAAIDGALLGSLSALVMWLTLRWCGLPLDRALMLPVLIPTSVFLALLGVVYLVMFNAAGGQTLGKMVMGLRVVREVTPFDAGGPVSFGQATLRAVLTLPSVLAGGAGFVPALIGEERAVHDRLAHTRVVRA
jgi:uncharacterized RDD family membrane protein YckC